MEEIYKISKNISFSADEISGCGILPFAVLSRFQSIAIEHAEKLGVGYKAMFEQDLFWVTMRIKFEVLRQPNADEQLELVTYPSGKNMLEFDRDYLIFDANKNIVIKGTSKWCFINTKTRRIAKLSAIDHIKLPDVKPAFEGRFVKNEIFEPVTLADFSYQIKRDDIDGNNHTNNTVYAKMIEEILKRQTKKIHMFQINFLKETMLGDRIDIFKKDDKHSLDLLGKLCDGDASFLVHIENEG